MFIKAIISFLVLPFVVAGIVPCILFFKDPWRGEGYIFGLPIMAGGLFLLLWCVRDFYISGRGTLAPWSPPKHLVTTGFYRFCRNPMYIGVLTLIGGWALLASSPLIACYLVVLFLGFHFRVVLYEEPRLSKLFDTAWKAYSSSIPRWLPDIKKSQER